MQLPLSHSRKCACAVFPACTSLRQPDCKTIMRNDELEFSFDGRGASAGAEALAEFFNREFPDWPASRAA